MAIYRPVLAIDYMKICSVCSTEATQLITNQCPVGSLKLKVEVRQYIRTHIGCCSQ